MIAIHKSDSGFHPRWIAYCEQQGISYQLVNCYDTDIMLQLEGCRALMWHHSQSNPRDIVIARQILSALEHAEFKVFPDFRTAWHFDDKVAQKYLFEALGIPAIPAYVFVDRDQALEWVNKADFPKVFKLRHGASSAGVCLAHNQRQARKLVRQAFGRGFSLYDPWGSLKERIYKVRSGKEPASEILKGLGRIVYPPRFSQILGRERGYVYFQDYMPGNDSDTRVTVIGDRAFGSRRFVRPGDFRASGSGRSTYAREDVDERCVKLTFETADKLGSDCVALDLVLDEEQKPRILEVSYGFSKASFEPCPGYWDRDLGWHPGKVDPQEWMIDLIYTKVREGV